MACAALFFAGLLLIGKALSGQGAPARTARTRRLPGVRVQVEPEKLTVLRTSDSSATGSTAKIDDEDVKAAAFCAAIRTLSDDTAPGQYNLLFAQLQSRVGGEFQELLSADGPYFQQKSDRTSTLGRFISALSLAGMMSRQTPIDAAVDLKAAWEELDRLHIQDPENAVYSYFRLVIERRLEMGEPQIEATLQELARASKFDSLYTAFMREVHVQAVEVQDPATFIQAISFLSRLPVPDFSAARREIGEVLASAPEIRDHLAHLMAAPALNAEKSYVLYGYNVLEYAEGRFYSEAYLPGLSELESAKQKITEPWDGFAFDLRTCGVSNYRESRVKLQNLQRSNLM